MDKLIITVTCDSTMAYPSKPHNPTPRGYDEVAREYVRSVNAGASICHLHGPYTIDATIQADGTRLSDLDVPGCGGRPRRGTAATIRSDLPSSLFARETSATTRKQNRFRGRGLVLCVGLAA